jgi:hypothetical protein
MQGQSEPKREFPESEKGFEQERDKQRQGEGGQPQDRGSTGTGTATGTAPQDPGTTQQDQSTTQDTPIRNPSGDDLSQGIEGDEGSGRGI